jgi:hypothetical protein
MKKIIKELRIQNCVLVILIGRRTIGLSDEGRNGLHGKDMI